MKKILVALGIFALGSIVQLVLGTIFLFVQVDLVTELCTMAVLLVFSAFGLAFLEQLERQPQVTDQLTDAFRMTVYHCGRFSTVLLVLQTMNFLSVCISFLYVIPFWVQAAIMLVMVVVLILAVLVAILVNRADGGKKSQKKMPPEPDNTMSET